MAAAGAAGLAAALTACGGSDDSSGSAGSSDSGTPSGSAETGSGTSNGGSSGGAAGTALTTTAEIPEGGGKVFADQKVVVSQPAAGEFKAFSTICTHQKCPMVDLKDDILSCSCHGSQFSITDGSVKKGPATEPLPAQQITVKGDSITLA
jgi:Rieske Fe-S protein